MFGWREERCKLRGHIGLGGLAEPGSIELTSNNNIFNLSLPLERKLGDVVLANDAVLSSSRFIGAGNINIQAHSIFLNSSSLEANGSFDIISGHVVDGSSGSIALQAQDIVSLIDDSINTHVGMSDGNAGDVTIKTGSFISKGTSIDAGTNDSNGRGGNISILVDGSATFMGGTPIFHSAETFTYKGKTIYYEPYTEIPKSIIDARLGFAGGGRAGDIVIKAGSVSFADTQILTTVQTGSTAGNIFIQADGAMSFVDSLLSSSNNNGATAGGLVGNTTIKAGSLSLIKTGILANTNGKDDGISRTAGDILIQIDGLSILSNSHIFSQASGISRTDKRDKSGRIELTVGSLALTNESVISTSSISGGNAGNILIQADDTVSLANGSSIRSAVERESKGDGGSIIIKTNSLNLTSGGQLNASVVGERTEQTIFGPRFMQGGKGIGGTIQVVATDSVNISGFSPDRVIDPSLSPPGTSSGIYTSTGKGAIGQGGNITVNTDTFRVADGGVVSAQTLNPSDGGNISITANTFNAVNGGQVLTTTFNSGKAGNIEVSARDRIGVSGIDLGYTARFNQFGGGIVANVSSASGVFANASINSSGNGGSLSLTTTKLNLSDGGQISSQSQGSGSAGGINANARSIRLWGNSDILTISNSGDGGNITLNAKTIVALENSDILAFAPTGRGGNITLNTQAFLSDPLYRPSPPTTDRAVLNALLTNARVDVNASGAVSGAVNGVPDISFLQNGLTQLPASLTDTTQLLANSCIVRRGQQNGSFTITGSGGLPQRPGDASVSSFPTGEVRTIAEVRGERRESVGASTLTQNSKLITQSSPDRSWKIGDPIVEPQGAYQLPDGQLILSRECSN